MKFARIVFTIAGIWGIAVLTPLCFLLDITGRQYAAPVDYPHFFYGFISVAMAWQIAFLIIGTNPVRYRLLMIPAVLEKFGYVLTLIVLYSRGRIPRADFGAAVPDFLIGALLVAAFAKTPHSADRG